MASIIKIKGKENSSQYNQTFYRRVLMLSVCSLHSSFVRVTSEIFL